MASWYHYIPERGAVVVVDSGTKPTQTTSRSRAISNNIKSKVAQEQHLKPHRQEQQQDCFRSSSPPAVQVSTSSISVLLPEKYESSLEIAHTLSSGSMQTSINNSHSSESDYNGTFQTDTVEVSSQIPRRNLTEAFEELYIKPIGSTVSETDTPLVKQAANTMEEAVTKMSSIVSPTAVTEIDTEVSTTHVGASTLVTPNSKNEVVGKLDDKLGFHLHPSLQRDLSDALIQRVSFYAIIHDINKEANSMAANDDSGFNRPVEELNEEYDPIVVAVQGYPKTQINGTSSMTNAALIDEEQWLLDVIDARSSEESRIVNACPPTFSQAMGERDHENPLTSLSNGSRTQLWKPSRSWWEAKSGKNPWIEPKNHNKRWRCVELSSQQCAICSSMSSQIILSFFSLRYLWPLIHYHKFLAKCIKKLKRNSVDVKTSVSPVAVFLREEVCAVSDHLARVSLFDSDEWMACLDHFNGWTESNETAKKHSREMVSKLKLRPLVEPGDVDSPLLRSQIDEQYLRAMATARAQLIGTEIAQDDSAPKDSMRRRGINTKSKSPSFESLSTNTVSAPVAHPVSTPTFKGQHGNISTPNMPLRHWHGYCHPPAWWQGGWHHPGYPYTDDASVQSALSGDTSLSHNYVNGYHHGSMPHYTPYYPAMIYQYPHMMHGHHYELGAIPDGSVYTSGDMQMTPGSWLAHPPSDYSMHTSKVPDTPGGVPATPSRNPSEDQYESQNTPYKYSPAHAAMSPYWAHLQDHATLSMMGLATPQAPSDPATPHHGVADSASDYERGSDDDTKHALNAQPLLLRQQYYGYGVSKRQLSETSIFTVVFLMLFSLHISTIPLLQHHSF
jgi:hypothetical protein